MTVQAAETRIPVTGTALLAARVLWVGTFFLVILLFARGIPVTLANLHHVCHSSVQNCLNWQLTPVGMRSLRESGISLDQFAAYIVAINLSSAAVWIALALFMFWRMAVERMAVAAAFFLLLFPAGTFGGIVATLGLSGPWRVPVAVVELLGQVSLLAFFCVFPDGRFVPAWTRWILPAAVIVIAPQVLAPHVTASNSLLWNLGSMAVYAPAVLTQIYRYRRVSTPRQRRQTRWVLLGGILCLASIITMLVVAGFFLPAADQTSALMSMLVDTGWYLFMLPIPISIGIAVLRHQLWDVDLLINRTLVYGSLTASLGAAYFISVVALQALVRLVTGQGSALVVALSTLGIAALFGPLRRRIQAGVDRRFYRRKYDAAKTLAAFSANLRDQVDLDRLGVEMTTVIQETMQPAHMSFWLIERREGASR
jgi:hypothetical protein